MNAFKFATLRQEPIYSGIVTSFLTLCAIAFVNLVGSLLSVQSQLSGVILLAVAILAALSAGAVAMFRSNKITTRRHAELKTAKSLASGDFSHAICVPDHGRTDFSIALTEIADRQLAIERNNGQLIQEAAARESHLLSTLDCVSQEIAVFDKSGLLICANSAYLSKCNTIGAIVALGMTRNEVMAELAKAPRANLPLNERQLWFKIQEELRQDALSSKMPMRFVRLNGEAAQLSVHTTKDGHQVEIIEDIAAVISLEQRAQKAERETLASDRLKLATLSRLSHTIRTPMTGVLAAAELLSDTTLDEKQRARLDIIRRSAGTLLGVVQDMFDLAENTNSSKEIKAPQPNTIRKQALICSTPEGLAQQASEVLSNDDYEVTVFEPFSSGSGAIDTWKLAAQKNASLIILADLNQKDQILAITHNANFEGRPDLKLFSELLQQTKNPAALTDMLVNTGAPTQKHADKVTHLDMLIVESNEVNQIYFCNSLENSGYNFKVVGTGAAAIEFAKDAKPSIILMDISIPDINGLDVTAAIRASTASSAPAPLIIGMANHFVQGDHIKCLAAGMDQYLAKPQTGQELLSLINDWLKPEPLKMAG